MCGILKVGWRSGRERVTLSSITPSEGRNKMAKWVFVVETNCADTSRKKKLTPVLILWRGDERHE
jgi:hypothetical protein